MGGIFEGIGNLIDLASKLSEEAKEIKREGEIKGLGGKAKGVYGFSIRTLVGGKPVVETFGNIKRQKEGSVSVKPDPVELSFRNGMLELKLGKKDS